MKANLVQLEKIPVVVGGVGKQVILMLTQSSWAGARTELGKIAYSVNNSDKLQLLQYIFVHKNRY